jgi:hypothetical protein
MENENESIETANQRPMMSLLKCLGWGVLVLAALVAIGLLWHRGKAASKLREKLAELDRTDPGWRLEDIEAAREDIPDEENSARVIAAAVLGMPRPWPPPDFPHKPFELISPIEKLNDDDFARLSTGLASVRPALDVAIKLADMPRGRHPIQFGRNPIDILLPHLDESRKITTLLIYESMRRNQKGETKNALAVCRAALNAARSIGDEPSYMSQLVRSLCVIHACQAIERTLGQAEPASEDLRSLQKLLENEDAFPGLLVAARGERAMFHGAFEAVERGDVSYDELDLMRRGGTTPDWLESATMKLGRMNIREDHVLFLSLTTRHLQKVQRPIHDQVELENQFDHDVRELPKSALMTRSLLPSFTKMGETFRQKHAMLRCTIVALAVERYRHDKKAWPDSLIQVCPRYLTAVPLDPYDGKSLRYRRVEDGIVIYSLGRDVSDNGGTLDRGQSASSGVDTGVRLWDVGKRRQAPQAKPLAPNQR